MTAPISESFYIHPSIFERMRWDQIDHPENRENMVRRPHEILKHAENRINSAQSDHDLIDGICALKRSVMIRTKDLRALYKLKHLPLSHFPKEQFDQLLNLEIIKPKLLSTIIEVRRIVEHMDGPPPEKARCQELSEFTWYFLKATDVYVSRVFDGMHVSIAWKNRDADYEIYVSINPQEDWKIDLHGTLPPFALSLDQKPDWFKCQSERLYANKDAPSSEFSLPTFGSFKERLLPDDIHFSGLPDGHFRDFLIRKYFRIIA